MRAGVRNRFGYIRLAEDEVLRAGSSDPWLASAQLTVTVLTIVYFYSAATTRA